MTDEERGAKFIEELERLMRKWGISLDTSYSHTVDGLKIEGKAKISVTPNANWQPPAKQEDDKRNDPTA